MTRTSLISVVYCSLETPAKSAAPYTHQWHTKPTILGLNPNPVAILISFLPAALTLLCSSMDFYKLRDRRVNLGQELFIGIVLQLYSPCGTLCVAEAVSFTEDRINHSLLALSRLTKLYGAILAARDTCPACDTLLLLHLANSAGGGD